MIVILGGILGTWALWRSQSHREMAAAVKRLGGTFACEIDERAVPRRFQRPSRVRINGSRIADGDLNQLTSLRGVRYLELSNCQITTAELKSLLSGLNKLSVLNLDSTAIEPTSLIERLLTSERLFAVQLAGNTLIDTDCATLLRSLKHVRFLGLEKSLVGDRCIEEIEAATHLEVICLEGTRFTSQGIERLKTLRPDLQVWSAADIRLWFRKFEPF